MIDVRIPKLGMSSVEVDIVRVLVSVGDPVSEGTVLLEVDSEKATVDVPSIVGGVVAEILVTPGQTCIVGDLVMRIQGES